MNTQYQYQAPSLDFNQNKICSISTNHAIPNMFQTTMKIHKTGFILYTVNYEECVSFYEKTLRLKVLYRKDTLTCFDFHGSYLMVEIDDETKETEPSLPSRDRICVRLNVSNVKKACEALDENSIPYSYNEFDWGTIAKFRDPDGNLIGFRSAEEHEFDIESIEKKK